MRVKGIYRALAYETEKPFWNNFFADIYPANLDSPPPPTFAFTDRRTVFELVNALGGSSIEHVYELPVEPEGPDARRGPARSRSASTRSSATLALPRGTLARKLRCTPEFRVFSFGGPSGCLRLELAAAGDRDRRLGRERGLAGRAAALVASGSGSRSRSRPRPGVFAVRRRRVEAALAFSRGEHVASFSARTALEALLATVAGGLAGFALAYGADRRRSRPNGTLNGTTFRAGAWQSAAAVAVGLGLLTLTAAFAYLRLYDTGLRRRRWPRWLVWELPLLAVAIYLLVDLERGGGLAQSGTLGGAAPDARGVRLPAAARRRRDRPRRPARAPAAPARLRTRAPAAGAGLPGAPPPRRRARAARRARRRLGGVVRRVLLRADARRLARARRPTRRRTPRTAATSRRSSRTSEVLPRDFPYPVTKVAVRARLRAREHVDRPEARRARRRSARRCPACCTGRSAWGPDPTPLLDELADAPRRRCR